MQKFTNWALIIVIAIIAVFAVRYVTRPIEAEAHFRPHRPHHNFCHIHPDAPRCQRPATPRPPAGPIDVVSEGGSSSKKSMRRRWDVVMMFKAMKAKKAQELSTAAVDTTEQ